MLASKSAEAIDATAVNYLFWVALKKKTEEEAALLKIKVEEKKREEEHRTLRLNNRVRADLPLTSDEHAALRRWSGLPPKT